MPAELAAVVSAESRGLALPGFLQSLAPGAPHLEVLDTALREYVLTHVDWFARTTAITWTSAAFELGYCRESMVASLPGAQRPVLWVNTQTGDLRVSASLWHALVQQADYARSPSDMRRRLGIDASNCGIDQTALDLTAARAESQRLETAVFQTLVERVPSYSAQSANVADVIALARHVLDEDLTGTQTLYLLHTDARPWVAGQVSRSGGPPVGVDRHTRPRSRDGTYMAHILTIDVRDAPGLREHALIRDRPATRALALFMVAPLSFRKTLLQVEPHEQALVYLTDEDLARGEWNDEPIAELPRRRL